MDVKKLNRLILLPLIFWATITATSTSIGQFSNTTNIEEIDILKADLGISQTKILMTFLLLWRALIIFLLKRATLLM